MKNAASNILESVHNAYYQLTVSERRVADYVLSNYSKVQFMSISELAESSSVSESTITRFCKSIGIRGFNQFKIELAGYVASSLPTKETTSLDARNLEDRARISRGLILDAVSQTQDLIDPAKIQLTIDILRAANHVMCIGSGGSMILATECAHLFNLVDHKFFEVADSHRQMTVAATMSPSDAIILFSYSGATINGVEMLQLAKKEGAKTILITRFPKSPAGKLADIVLCCGSSEGPYQIGSIPAAVAQLYLMDILFQEYCSHDPESSAQNIHRVASALSVNHI